jgi:hypothetical protein
MTALEQEIRELYRNYRPLLPEVYRWEDEMDRWHELAFCAFLEVGCMGEQMSREIVTALASLGLLEPVKLAAALTKDGSLDLTNETISSLMTILGQKGFEEKTAHEVLLAVCEMAAGIQNKYGKLQILLRKHGQNILKDLQDATSFSHVQEEIETLIFARWLQNALELPIPLADEYVKRFCSEREYDINELITVADEIDVSIAVVDDLIRLRQLNPEY